VTAFIKPSLVDRKRFAWGKILSSLKSILSKIKNDCQAFKKYIYQFGFG
jgi:hypothetical protein